LRSLVPAKSPAAALAKTTVYAPFAKQSYRSHYQYLGWEDLQEGLDWATVDDFDLLLRLIDFSPLRDVLAVRLGWTSAQGKVPFDPLSLFLLTLWQIVNGWSRAQTLRNLRKPRYAEEIRRFGFRVGIFPSEGGLRHFLTTLGKNSLNQGNPVPVAHGDQLTEVGIQQLNQLLCQSVALIRESGVLSELAW